MHRFRPPSLYRVKLTVTLKVANINLSKICASFFGSVDTFLNVINVNFFIMTLKKIKYLKEILKMKISSPNTQPKKCVNECKINGKSKF